MLQEGPVASHGTRRPSCKPCYKKAQLQVVLQEDPVASHVTRRPRSQNELFDEPFTLLFLLHLHPQSFHQILCLLCAFLLSSVLSSDVEWAGLEVVGHSSLAMQTPLGDGLEVR